MMFSALNTSVDITYKKVSDNALLQNAVLISASRSGDVMRVVSLLNSGADVQTKSEVNIHFLSCCPHLYTVGSFSL